MDMWIARIRHSRKEVKYKRYAYHLRGSLLAMAVAITWRKPTTIQLIKY